MTTDNDLESTDGGVAGEGDAALDLSPRPAAPARPPRTGKQKWLAIGVLGIVVVAGGLIVTQFLRSAVDYYCNVDEIGERDGCEPGRRLRVQGNVDEGTVVTDAGYTTFTISLNGSAPLTVRYRGEPTGMFAECEPVVVHGRLDESGVFQGDSIDVKHSNEYVAENPDRVGEEGGPNCPASAA